MPDAAIPAVTKALEGTGIVEWVEPILNETGDIDAIVDPNLAEEFIDLSIKEQVSDVLELALRCTEKEADKRPTMRDVVKQLAEKEANKRPTMRDVVKKLVLANALKNSWSCSL